MLVELSEEERDLIAEVLFAYDRELHHEIFKTDHNEFKERLRHRERLIDQVLTKLEAVQRPAQR